MKKMSYYDIWRSYLEGKITSKDQPSDVVEIIAKNRSKDDRRFVLKSWKKESKILGRVKQELFEFFKKTGDVVDPFNFLDFIKVDTEDGTFLKTDDDYYPVCKECGERLFDGLCPKCNKDSFVEVHRVNRDGFPITKLAKKAVRPEKKNCCGPGDGSGPGLGPGTGRGLGINRRFKYRYNRKGEGFGPNLPKDRIFKLDKNDRYVNPIASSHEIVYEDDEIKVSAREIRDELKNIRKYIPS